MKPFRVRLAELILGAPIRNAQGMPHDDPPIFDTVASGEDLHVWTHILRVHRAVDGHVCTIAAFNPHGAEKYQMFVAQPGESATELLTRAYTLAALGSSDGT